MTLETLLSEQIRAAVEGALADFQPRPSIVLTQESLVPSKLAYSPEEVTLLLPIGEKAVLELLRSGELRSFKAGRKYVIPHASIQAWLERRTEQAARELDAEHAKYANV